jgi:hypothetical protein
VDAGSIGRFHLPEACTRGTRAQLVSSDIVGDPHAAIVDLSLTKVVDGDLCSVYSWYDNEFGYTNPLVRVRRRGREAHGHRHCVGFESTLTGSCRHLPKVEGLLTRQW